MKREIPAGICAVLLAGAVLIPVLLPEYPWPSRARDLLVQQGYQNTGASNLVAAMYLGYRAYDTLGELVVLIAALSAAIALINSAEEKPGPSALQGNNGTGGNGESRSGRRMHTDIIDLTAGKLSPMVLLFGWYLMFYGNRSPGGGFQGGVVLASGVVFIALGRREGGIGRLASHHAALGLFSLGWVETVSFFFIMVLCFAGPFTGAQFLEDPVPAGSIIPRGAYMIAFNIAIGLKVGSGIALLCLLMMGRAHD
jgi:multicomponent Na+:H+ antiporter subunit B